MQTRWALTMVAAFLCAALAGCADEGIADTASSTTTEPVAVGLVALPATVHGVVLDASRTPLPGANVTLVETNATTAADGAGQFVFDVPFAKVYTVRAEAPGHVAKTLFTTPELAPLEFILPVDLATVKAYQQVYEFDGHIDCAVDTLIIPGSCTTVLGFAGVPNPVFTDATNFTLPLEPQWRTVVFDFSSQAQPGLEGMRLVVRGTTDAAALNAYEQYGRFGGEWAFTARVEPGGNYTDGVAPVPANVTAFQVDAYPQGQLYHQACVPPGDGGVCFTGVGAGANVEFKLIVTAFYVDPAPEGFTQRAS